MATDHSPYLPSSIGAMHNLSPPKHKSKLVYSSSHTQLYPDLQDSLTKLDDAISDSVREDMPILATAQVFTPERNTDKLTDSFDVLTGGELQDSSKLVQFGD